MKSTKVFFMLLIVLTLSACNPPNKHPQLTSEKSPTSDSQPDNIVDELEIPVHETNVLLSFFMPNGSIADYLGEGNEFASYQSRTHWHNDNTVSIYEDNGGTTLLRTYRINKNAIVLIHEEGEYYEEYNPTDDELNVLQPISTYLQLPLEEGTSFDDWHIRNVNQTIETPYRTFNHVILLEKTEESGNINRRYIVKDYGEIKREYLMNDGESENVVSSTLENVK